MFAITNQLITGIGLFRL